MASGWKKLARVLAAAVVVAAVAGGLGYSVAQQRSAAALSQAASAFLDSLSPELRARATFPLGEEEQTRWHFIPTNQFPRNGVPFKDMDAAQRRAAHDLLRTALGHGGYMTATTIMDLENILKEIEGPDGQFVRDPELYYFTIFGEPGPTSQWGMRVEGHHLSVHFTIDGAKMAVSSAPAFFGSNPAEVRTGPRTGLRTLGTQEDAGRALLATLSDEQRAKAIISDTAPRDIATRTQLQIDPLEPGGLMASEMTPDQRALLMDVIGVYADLMADDIAADRLAKIEAAGIEKIGFAWAGSTERGERYHYRIQGPTFLIEHNNTQNNGNHVHSVWRDFDGDFGRDLLGEHLATVAH
jgi:hypothetical protein